MLRAWIVVSFCVMLDCRDSENLVKVVRAYWHSEFSVLVAARVARQVSSGFESVGGAEGAGLGAQCTERP